jgi:hypothetical protein
LLLVTITTANIVAINYTQPQYTVTAQGTAHNPQYTDNQWTYTLMQGNQTLGTGRLNTAIKEGDQVTYATAQDSTTIPIIYQPRTWSIVIVNGVVTESTEPTTRLNILTYTWLGHLAGLITYKAIQLWRRK